MPTIDAQFHPHIVDMIWDHMTEDSAIVAGNVCRSWRDRAIPLLMKHIALHRRDDNEDADPVLEDMPIGAPLPYRRITGRVLIKSYTIGSKRTMLLKSLRYRRREIYNFDADEWFYEKEEIDEDLGMDLQKLLAKAEVVEAVNWNLHECQLGELTDLLFRSTRQVQFEARTYDMWSPIRPADPLRTETASIRPPLVRWRVQDYTMPHWDLGPSEVLFFLDYSHAQNIAEVFIEDFDKVYGRKPHACRHLTLSIDCYCDPVLGMWDITRSMGPGDVRGRQDDCTILLFNRTGKKRGEGFDDVGHTRGLLVNYFETFPNGVFSDVTVVGLEEFFEEQEPLEQYQDFLRKQFKKTAKEHGLHLRPSASGAVLVFRTHAKHKAIMDDYYGPGGYERRALR